MEPVETSIEETAGQIAAVAKKTAETASETADQAVNTMAEKTETTSEAAVEAVNTIADDVVATVEGEQVQMDATSTQETTQQNSSTCPMFSCDPMTVGIIIAVVAVAVIIVALLSKKKKRGGKAELGKPGKSNGPDMVEIYVGNLSYDMTDAQLRREFERFGVVKSARVITHRTNSKSKGYGFVEMPHRKEALIGIKALDNSEVLGRRIRVNEARANTRPPER